MVVPQYHTCTRYMGSGKIDFYTIYTTQSDVIYFLSHLPTIHPHKPHIDRMRTMCLSECVKSQTEILRLSLSIAFILTVYVSCTLTVLTRCALLHAT